MALIRKPLSAWPTCAVCLKPVEEMHTYRLMDRDVEVYIARCHGQEERTELTMEQAVNSINIEAGFAFDTKRLGTC